LFNGSSPLPNVTCIIIFTVYAGSDYPVDSSIEPLMLRGPDKRFSNIKYSRWVQAS
jgi:hypothetical protein